MDVVFTEILNHLISQGILIAVLWGWAVSKGKKIDRIADDIGSIKTITDRVDERGNLIVYGKDADIIRILDRQTELLDKQNAVMASILAQQNEIRNDIANHMCPFKGKKVD